MSNTPLLLEDCIPDLLSGTIYNRRLYYRVAKYLNLFLRRKAIVEDLATVQRDELADFLRINHAEATVKTYVDGFNAMARKLGVMNPVKRHGRRAHELSDAPGTLWHTCREEYFRVNIAIRSHGTRMQYRAALWKFKLSLGHEPRHQDLNDENMAAYFNFLVDRGCPASSANRLWSKIRALWDWLARKRRVAEFPTIVRLPEPRRVPKAWTLEQLSKLVATCRRQPGEIVCGITAADWWCGFHYVLWDTGERLTAMLSLEWTMLDMESGVLTVPCGIRKGQRSEESYRLKTETVCILARIKSAGNQVIFPLRKSLDTFFKDYTKLLTQAGLPTDGKSKTHRMRKSVASHMAARGFDACAALRHSSPQITKRYLDPSIVATVQPSDVLPSLDELT